MDDRYTVPKHGLEYFRHAIDHIYWAKMQAAVTLDDIKDELDAWRYAVDSFYLTSNHQDMMDLINDLRRD